MASGGIKVHVYGDYDDRDINRAIRDLGRMRKGGDDTASGLAVAAGKIGKVMAVAGVAVAGAAVVATKQIVDLGRQYEDTMLKFQAVTGATASEMEQAADAAKALGNDITLPGVSAADAAGAMVELGKAGFSVADSMKAADGTMRLAIAGELGVAEASTLAANAVLAFKLNSEDATMVADLLAAGANATSAEVGDMGAAMQQSAALFSAAKIPIQDLVTGIGLLANEGIKGSDAGTSLKTMLQKLQNPTGKAAGMLKELGVNVYDADGAMRPFRDIVDNFSTSLEGMTQQQRDQAIATIFGSDASRAANIVLADGVEKYDAMAQAVTKVGAAQDMAAATTKGLSGAIESIQSSLETMAIEIYEQIAPSLNDFFRSLQPVIESLSPVLSSLGVAFAKIAEAVGTALVGALEALLPSLLPFIEMIAEVGERMGPLLARILERVADVLGSLLEALMPLLEPLMDLVFTILEAAMPILDIVADLFIVLADALQPVFEIVGALLKPIGELIRVGFEAIEPVLRPLMPVIEAFAAILGDVLVRAIGFLMTAFGSLLQAWSKIAPFVLDYVITPIVNGFLSFAEDIVGYANLAFSWVPGLGDKLATAKEAIAEFRTKATDAVGKAADAIEAEGGRIAQGLIDNGVQAMTNPASMSKLNRAGYGAGSELVAGIAAGMTSNSSQRTLTNASGWVITTADGAARRAAEAQSPSKRFAKIGIDLIDGLIQGLETGKGKLSEKGKGIIDEAFTAFKGAVDEAKSLGQQITDGLFSNISMDDALTAAKETGGSIVDAIVAQSNRAQEFGQKMQRLLEAGLNPHIWRQIAGMSADRGIEVADAYLNGNTAEMVKRTNDAVLAAENVATAVGKNASYAFSAAGLKAAADFLEAAIREFLPSGKKRKKLLDLVDDLIGAMSKTATVSVNAVINGTPVSMGGGGGGGAPMSAPTATPSAAPSSGDWVGAAASAAIGAQFDAATLANAQALNAAAPYGTDAILALGFTAAEWDALKALEAANNAAAGLARGGWARANVPYWVGERGPELVTFDKPSYVNSNRRSMNMGGNTYNITVQAGVGDPRSIGKSVVEAITRFEQSNGPIYAKAS